MLAKANGWIVSGVMIALCGCGEDKPVVPPTMPAGVTTNASTAESAPASMPSTTIEWLDVPTDAPTPFETPLGKDFVVKKSGLAWKILEPGFDKGQEAQIGNRVDVRYTIYRTDMKRIESNEEAKMGTYGFMLGAKSNDILPFWHEATLGMKLKAKKRLIVPANLAWGKAGLRSQVDETKFRVNPDETLIIDVKIERIYDKTKAQRDKEAIAATQPETLPDTIPSDLIVEETKEGTGEFIKSGQRGTFKYVGKLDNGTIFDQGDAFAFRLGTGQVIRGWEFGVRNMRVGSVRKLTVPGHLAYGEKGQGPIPPNATLHFEIELIKIDP
jgi:FKBP-type peptidyl-prolyl cis-trans isomerase